MGFKASFIQNLEPRWQTGTFLRISFRSPLFVSFILASCCATRLAMNKVICTCTSLYACFFGKAFFFTCAIMRHSLTTSGCTPQPLSRAPEGSEHRPSSFHSNGVVRWMMLGLGPYLSQTLQRWQECQSQSCIRSCPDLFLDTQSLRSGGRCSANSTGCFQDICSPTQNSCDREVCCHPRVHSDALYVVLPTVSVNSILGLQRSKRRMAIQRWHKSSHPS